MAVVDSSEFMRSGFDSTIFIILPSPHAASASSIPTIQRTSTCTIEEKRGGRVSWLGVHTRETSGTKNEKGWGIRTLSHLRKVVSLATVGDLPADL